MDTNNRLKRSKQDGSNALHTPKKTSTVSEPGCEFSDDCNSPDFLSSQECFSVGWDWSDHLNENKKPTIRVVERPVKKKTGRVQLLECSRPRRLVRKHDMENVDDSAFVTELKSLAAGCKGIPETTSPVASPPSFRRKKEVLVTPTALRESMRRPLSSKSVESSSNVSTLPSSLNEIIEEEKTSLNDLLDESFGADLIKLTQDIEQNFRQNESKTPNCQEKESKRLSSTKRKNRLSLSSKKRDSTFHKSVCRRINNVYEENVTVVPPKHNNNNVLPKIEFDDIDEAMMLTLGRLEEQELVKSKEAVSSEEIGTSNDASKVEGAKEDRCNLEVEDDEFVSPDLLDLIDIWEKKATQENKQSVPNLMNKKTTQMRSEATASKESSNPSNLIKQNGYQQPPRKSLCLAKTKTICTPEEIEKKRQDAKKRLQLKKKCPQ